MLIEYVYDGLKALIEDKYPSVNADEVNISLIDIENTSEKLTFATSGQQEVEDAIRYFGEAVSNNEYTDLPTKAYRAVKLIFREAKGKGCSAELVQKGGRLFVVTPKDNLIEQENVLVRSSINLYGELNQVRANKPRAWLDLHDGSKVSFSLTADQVVQLRGSVKEFVGLRGEARWSTLSNKVVSFRLHDVLTYKPGNAKKGFDDLREISGGFWDSLHTNKDVTNFLKGEA